MLSWNDISVSDKKLFTISCNTKEQVGKSGSRIFCGIVLFCSESLRLYLLIKGFFRWNVNEVFSVLENALVRVNFCLSRIYDIDEMGLSQFVTCLSFIQPQ